MSKEQIEKVMQGDSEMNLKYVNLKNVDYFERLKADYQARIGNVVLGLCKDIKRGDIRDAKRRYGVNDKGAKIAAKRTRSHRANVLGHFEKLFVEMSIGEQANFLMSVQQIEREQDLQRRVE